MFIVTRRPTPGQSGRIGAYILNPKQDKFMKTVPVGNHTIFVIKMICEVVG